MLLTAQITGLAQRRFSVGQKEEGGRGERRMEGKKKGREEGRKGGGREPAAALGDFLASPLATLVKEPGVHHQARVKMLSPNFETFLAFPAKILRKAN